MNDYKTTYGWRDFKYIEEIEENISDRVKAIDETLSYPVDNQPTYNLRGQRVSKPVKGLFIKNGKKVLMR